MAKVLIYTTQVCPFCRRTKEFFKANKVKYNEIDVGNDAKAVQEMIKKSGQMGVPVIDIDGEIVVGFNEPKLRKVLGIKYSESHK